MNSKPLFKAIVEAAAFFELSDDEIVDADIAVREMEHLAAALRELDEDGRQQFIDYVAEAVESERMKGSDVGRIRFIASIPEAFGLQDQ